MAQTASIPLDFIGFDEQILADGNRPQILNGQLRSDGTDTAKVIQFAHGLIQQGRDDSPVNETWPPFIFSSETECTTYSPRGVVLLEGESHAAWIRASATKASVRRVGLEKHTVPPK